MSLPTIDISILVDKLKSPDNIHCIHAAHLPPPPPNRGVGVPVYLAAEVLKTDIFNKKLKGLSKRHHFQQKSRGL